MIRDERCGLGVNGFPSAGAGEKPLEMRSRNIQKERLRLGLSMLVSRLEKRILTWPVILLAMSMPLPGQVLTSRVDGTVRDQTGAFMPGVSVQLTNVETNAARETVTNAIGLFVFPQIPRGPYRLAAQLPGFKTAILEGVRVELDTPVSVDMVLDVGGADEMVIVTATQAQSVVNDINAEINTNLNREQVKELPLNGRSVTQLALTQAGVTSRGGARFPLMELEGPLTTLRSTGSTTRTR